MISIHLSSVESDDLYEQEMETGLLDEQSAARFIRMPAYFLRWDRQKYRPSLITYLKLHTGEVRYRTSDLESFSLMLRRDARAEAKLTCVDTNLSYDFAFKNCLDTIKYQLRLDARRKD